MERLQRKPANLPSGPAPFLLEIGTEELPGCRLYRAQWSN